MVALGDSITDGARATTDANQLGGTSCETPDETYDGFATGLWRTDGGGVLPADAAVGAFQLAGPATKDSVLLVTLAPGNYTAQVGPSSGTAGGTAIIEVYEVP